MFYFYICAFINLGNRLADAHEGVTASLRLVALMKRAAFKQYLFYRRQLCASVLECALNGKTC